MKNLIKKDYVISIWDEVKSSDSTSYSPSFNEKELMIIGTDKDESPCRAFNPKLVRDVNGNKTLTFEMFLRYYDEERETTMENPFCSLLVNERHIKLRNKGKWYDFIIKDVRESSNSKKVIYTAKDYFVNELSKTGYSLVLNSELRNNTGTIEHLAKQVLQGTDWKVSDNSEVLRQTIEQPLYIMRMSDKSEGINQQMIEPLNKNGVDGFASNYNTGEIVRVRECFVFYKDYAARYDVTDGGAVKNKNQKLQILIPTTSIYDDGVRFKKDSEGNIILETEEENMVAGVQAIIALEDGSDHDLNSCEANNFLNFEFITAYRGNELVKTDEFFWDQTVDRNVKRYKNENDQKFYLGYSVVQESAPGLVTNLLENSTNFTSTLGWNLYNYTVDGNGKIQKEGKNLEVKRALYQNGSYYTKNNAYVNSLFINHELGDNLYLESRAIYDNRQSFGGIHEGDVFYFRILATGVESSRQYFDCPKKVEIYEINGNTEEKIVNFEQISVGSSKDGSITYDQDSIGYYWYKGTVSKQLSEKELEMNNNIKFRFQIPKNNIVGLSDYWYYLDFQLFRESKALYTKDGEEFAYLITPDGYLDFKTGTFYTYGNNYNDNPNGTNSNIFQPEAVVTTKYYLYPEAQYQSAADIKYLVYDKIPDEFVLWKSSDDPYEKIKMIEQSETNRFDILTKLCETFECWMDFDIERDEETGEIISKSVRFKRYLNKQKYYGFSYGLNLSSIERSIESTQLATKIIVNQNSNEYAEGGRCDIAKAKDNPTSDKFFYNFDYYVNNGMLNKDSTTKDLFLHFYPTIKNYNALLLNYSEQIIGYQTQLDSLEESYVTSSTIVTEGEEQIAKYDNALRSVTYGKYDWEQCKNNDTNYFEAEELGGATYLQKLAAIESAIGAARQQAPQIKKQHDDYLNRIESLKEQKKNTEIQKQNQIESFEKGYSRFIQEGAWNSEDYIDSNLYYYDAEATLYESSHPKIEYTFDVIDISTLDDFKDYQFDVGDKTWVEDTEFFGWIYDKNSTKIRPYREEVIVYEYEENLDDPRKDKITIKTFKSQFEDLFQRIGNTVNKLEFKQGSYNRAAGIVNSNGTINNIALQNTFLENSQILQDGVSQSVNSGSTGITVTSLTKPNEIVRVVSGGIVLSEDGGKTWRTGVTGHGISADKITAGVINTGEISIMNGSDTSFSWTNEGIKAFKQIKGGDGATDKTSYAKFSSNGLEIFKNGTNLDDRVFYTDGEGNLTLQGTVKAGAGQIGDWQIDYGSFWNGKSGKDAIRIGASFESLPNSEWNSKYVNTTIRQGDNFLVTTNGTIYANNAYLSGTVKANSGNIGNWQIKDNLLQNDNGTIKIGPSFKYTIPNTTNEVDATIKQGDNFVVQTDGTVWATNAKIVGEITAQSGTIGGVNIVKDSNGNPTMDVDGATIIDGKLVIDKIEAGEITVDSLRSSFDKLGGWELTHNGNFVTTNTFLKAVPDPSDNLVFKAGDNFKVDANGTLTQQNQNIKGILNASSIAGVSGTSGISGRHNGSDSGFIFGDWWTGSSYASQFNFINPYDYNTSDYKNFETKIENFYDDPIPSKLDNFVNASYVNMIDEKTSGQHELIIRLNGINTINTESGEASYISIRMHQEDTSSGSGMRLFGDLGGDDTLNAPEWRYNGIEIATVGTNSDSRLKNSITPISQSNYSSLFDEIRPVSYRLNDEPDKLHFGFIAQEAIAAFENNGFSSSEIAAITKNSKDYYALVYREFIAILWAEVQKLKAEIKSLKS